MSQIHQLAAILFTDIVGYSAIMQEDENAALEKVNRFHQVLESQITEHNGKIIQFYGDGCLLFFNSSVDAVNLAIILQEEFNIEPRVPVRVGIHMGDVLLKDDNIYGDAVNIASRIQALAPAGGIWISEPVYKNIANKKNITTAFVKEEHLKNIKEPVRIYQVKTEIVKAPVPTAAAKKKKNKQKKTLVIVALGVLAILAAGYFLFNGFQNNNKVITQTNDSGVLNTSVAVLPFDDNSPGKDQEYLGDGIAEEILNVLTQMKGLKVPGRSSCFAFKGKGTDLITIGKILNVKSILEGSVQKFGDMVRVNVQLSNAENGYNIWSKQYSKELKNIYALQDEIADSVSKKLQLTFFSNLYNSEPRAVNPDAYESVLKGNLFLNKGDFVKATGYYDRAIEIDSAYAYPYIRKGWAIYQRTLYNDFPSKEGFSKASALLEKGLELKPTVSEKESAHHALAYINLWQYNWKKSWTEYEEVKKTDPMPGTVYAFYQAFVLGKTSEAVSVMKKAVDEDPFDILTLRDCSDIQYQGRQFAEALHTCDKILELDSTFNEAYRLKGSIYSAEGKLDSALYNFQKAYEKGNAWAFIQMIKTLPSIGQKEKARILFQQIDTVKSQLIPSFAKGLIYFSLGEKDKAFEWLNRAYNDRDFYLVTLKTEPLWDPLRSHPRFKKLVSKMNFPE
jgi:adenylate cyclase